MTVRTSIVTPMQSGSVIRSRASMGHLPFSCRRPLNTQSGIAFGKIPPGCQGDSRSCVSLQWIAVRATNATRENPFSQLRRRSRRLAEALVSPLEKGDRHLATRIPAEALVRRVEPVPFFQQGVSRRSGKPG
jgi:hypothetical protein